MQLVEWHLQMWTCAHTWSTCVNAHVLHNPFHVTSTSPRGWPSHLLEAVLRPSGALETPEELVTMQAPGPKEMPFRQLQQGTGFHTLEDMQSLTLFLALQGKGLTSAWVHVQPVCIGWLLRKIQQVRICQKIESSHPQGVPGL